MAVFCNFRDESCDIMDCQSGTCASTGKRVRQACENCGKPCDDELCKDCEDE